MEARKDVLTYKGHEGSIGSVAVSPDGKQILTGSTDKTMRLWGANTGNELRKFDGHQTGVNGVAFAPDGRRVASVSGNYLYDNMNQIVVKDGRIQYVDCTVRVWDVSGGKGPQVFNGHTATVYSAAFSTDGQKVASGAADLSLRLWGVTGGNETSLFPTKGHVYGIAYSPDGRFFVTTGSDAKVLVWDIATEKVVREWSIHETIGKVFIAPDSRHLSVTLSTGVVYIFRLPVEKAP
jgi:WD40 repeat protein